MIDRFLILNHGDPRPDVERIIYCDGAGGRQFRQETDLELSHWRPNRTPSRFRAGTSTEICFRFFDDPVPGEWTLAVNNHLDVDGLLSVYTLVDSRRALAQRDTIIAAAEMGDFWGWGESSAQRLFQGLTRLMNARSAHQVSVQSIYEEALPSVPGLIQGTVSDSVAIDVSLAPLRRAVELVERGEIRRVPRGGHFTQYVIPGEVVGGEMDRALRVPGFNEAISENVLLWPQARARWDAERVCLVSTEGPAGWYHDLWFPGYHWADTEGLWTVPGLCFRDGMDSYDLAHPGLLAAVGQLQRSETASGTWSLGDGSSPFHPELQSLFPVGLRFVDERGNPTPSRLAPDDVAVPLAAALA
ncbi:MAG TPA: DUF6687 family protein [Planctomycetaceae bacterium]|nr:DUF6687 family protein [Planctomycetaceae bacterium]